MISQEKIDAITTSNDSVLLQKNARCPKCGGTLHRIEGIEMMYIWCINCNRSYIPVETGLTDNELICKVKEPKPYGYVTNEGYMGKVDGEFQLFATEQEYLESLAEE